MIGFLRPMKALTRRQFGLTAAGAAATALASSSLPQFAFAQMPEAKMLRFADNFLWGCATASYQVEGAVHEDGRGTTVWDTFSHTHGKTYHGDTGDVAADSYHLYKEDVRLLKNLGVTGYRLSIAWSRIFPNATCQPNEEGLAYYQNVGYELLLNGIAPLGTLFHCAGTRRDHRSRCARYARRQCALPQRTNGRQIYRGCPGTVRRERSQSGNRGHEDLLQRARFRWPQRIYAGVRPRRFVSRRLRGRAAPDFLSAYGFPLAENRTGSDLLGRTQCERHLEAA